MHTPSQSLDLSDLHQRIIDCAQCPRLTAWCQQVAREKVKRFADDTYWGRSVPSFGDANARLVIVGLAPAAHGANRTGRMFTGDESGKWLYRALYRAGFCNQETSIHREDGLTLQDCYITAVNHCAPPANKPTPQEMQNCRPFLIEELQRLCHAQVVVALGKIAFDTVISVYEKDRGYSLGKKPKFTHGIEFPLNETLTLLASFHPSQQNTFTGKLTEPMLDSIFQRVKHLIG